MAQMQRLKQRSDYRINGNFAETYGVEERFLFFALRIAVGFIAAMVIYRRERLERKDEGTS